MTSMKVWARGRTALSLAALLALGACGGGGSSSSGGAAPTVSVAGVASKGLLAYAKVTAYAIKSDGSADKTKALGSAITDAKGAYQITGLPASTPVILEVTPLSAEGTRPATTMKDESTGTDVPVPVNSGFSLSAAVVLDASGSTTAPVTPLTDMVVNLAQSQLKTDSALPIKDAIAKAGDNIAKAMNVALNELPIFDGNGKPTNAAAIKLAAVSQLAQDACTGDTLAKVQCAVEKLRDEVKDTPKAGEPLLSDTFVTALSTAEDGVKVPEGVTKPAPVTNVNTEVAVGGEYKTAIQEAKALIASVRSTTTALSNKSDETSLAARVQAVSEASRGVAAPLNDDTITLLTAMSEAITAHQNGAAAPFPLDSGLWWQNGQGRQLVPGCRYYTSADFNVLANNRTSHLGCRVLQRVGDAYTAPAGWQFFAVYHRFGVTDVGNGEYTVKSILARAPIVNAETAAASYGAEQPLSESKSLTITSGSALSVTGFLAPTFESTWDNGSETIVVLGTHQQVAIALSETPAGTSTRYNLSGDVSVYQDTAVQSRVSLKSGSYIEEANVDGPTQPKAANLILEAQLKTGYKIGGTLLLSNFTKSDVRWGPTNGSFVGYITDVGGIAKLFDGSLTLLMPTDSGLGWDATLNGTLVTTGTNTLMVNLTAKQSETVQGDLTVTGRYTQGITTFLLTSLSSEAAPANDQLSLTTTAGGVGFVVKRSDATVPIKKGDTVLGTFNVSSSRLVYADGTYEQF